MDPASRGSKDQVSSDRAIASLPSRDRDTARKPCCYNVAEALRLQRRDSCVARCGSSGKLGRRRKQTTEETTNEH